MTRMNQPSSKASMIDRNGPRLGIDWMSVLVSMATTGRPGRSSAIRMPFAELADGRLDGFGRQLSALPGRVHDLGQAIERARFTVRPADRSLPVRLAGGAYDVGLTLRW